MSVNERYLASHSRSIKLAMTGKGDEAKNGALTVIQGLLRFLNGLKEKDQTYEVVMEMLEKLSKDFSSAK
jgi:hypothetical protein